MTSAHYEAARDEVARFVGAREDDVVVFTRSTTDSVNLLARALPRDTSVVVFASEHHATLLPWRGRDTVRLPVPGSTRDAEALLEAALRALPTGTARRPRQALVVLTAASNVTGEFVAGRAAHRDRPPARRPGAARRRAVRGPPGGRPRRARRRLGRVLRPQGARPLRHRRARRPQRLAGCRAALPRRWGRHRAGHRARHPLGHRRRPPRGGQPQRARRHRARGGLRDHPRAPRGDRRARGPAHRAPARRAARHRRRHHLLDLRRRHRARPGRHLHGRRARQQPRGGGPVGRARHRGAGRQVLRAHPGRHPARRGVRGARHRGAGQRRARQHARARRAAARRRRDAGRRRPGRASTSTPRSRAGSRSTTPASCRRRCPGDAGRCRRPEPGDSRRHRVRRGCTPAAVLGQVVRRCRALPRAGRRRPRLASRSSSGGTGPSTTG